MLGNKGYEVSNLGRVRSIDRILVGRDGVARHYRGRIRKQHIATDGYPAVSIGSVGQDFRTVKVHVLVARAFLGPGPTGQEVRHRDGDRRNPRLSNLIYGTKSENAYDRVTHGNHINANKTHCVKGHLFDGQNTYTTPRGQRVCKICRRVKGRQNYARRLAGTTLPPGRPCKSQAQEASA